MGELSRNGRHLGHGMLADTWESLKFALQSIGDFFNGVTPYGVVEVCLNVSVLMKNLKCTCVSQSINNIYPKPS